MLNLSWLATLLFFSIAAVNGVEMHLLHSCTERAKDGGLTLLKTIAYT